MSVQEDLQKIEITIEQARNNIRRKECLGRLEKNPDFIELIEKGFLEAHAVRQVMLKAHPALQEEKHQQIFDQQIAAIGGFKQYLISIFSEGMSAESALHSDEQTREELLAEDLKDE